MPNVLVLDDDSDLLEMVSIFLRQDGMEVQAINDNFLLLDLLGKSQPDVILMDIYLGNTDGRQLCLQLKQSTLYNHIPVILYSAGYISTVSIQESKADAFIAKPFNIEVMIEKIRSFSA